VSRLSEKQALASWICSIIGRILNMQEHCRVNRNITTPDDMLWMALRQIVASDPERTLWNEDIVRGRHRLCFDIRCFHPVIINALVLIGEYYTGFKSCECKRGTWWGNEALVFYEGSARIVMQRVGIERRLWK